MDSRGALHVLKIRDSLAFAGIRSPEQLDLSLDTTTMLPRLLAKVSYVVINRVCWDQHKGAANSLARPGMKQATATEDYDVHISYL
jgi:hypothetical protein